jgi:hypothetical protein
LPSNKSIIEVKENHIKGFVVVEQLLRETRGSPKYSSYPMPHPAIVPFYA